MILINLNWECIVGWDMD